MGQRASRHGLGKGHAAATLKGRAWRAGGLALAAALTWMPCHAGASNNPAAQQPPSAGAPPPASPAAAPVPLEHFARLPMFKGVSLSPDGARVAALANRGEDTLLVTRDVDSGELRALMKTDNLKFRFRWASWVGNERLLVSVIYPGRRGFTGTVESRLFSVNVTDGEVKSMARSGPPQQVQDQVIDWMRDDGRHVLLQLPLPEAPWPAVFKLDVATGAYAIVHGPQKGVDAWITDAQHRVRAAVRHEKDKPSELIVRDPQGGPWRVLWTFKNDETEEIEPLGFGADPQELWIRAPHEGRGAIFSVRLDEPGTPRTLRLAHPRHDVEGSLIRSPLTHEIVGVRGSGTDDARSELWDEDWRALAQAVDRSLPGRDNQLLQISRDGRRYLLHASGARQPGEYYVGDRDDGQLMLLARTYPDLKPDQLVGKKVVSIQARDGLALTAYLTRTRTGGQAPGPMVLLPHGGPYARDDASFGPWTELLANRGYSVLQVNFRGSTGYGAEFQKAGLQQWGQEMQEDLEDAVQWAVTQGVADPRRICIVGASYGGYAALMGVVKTPRLYRCAVSFAGVFDLTNLALHLEDFIGGKEGARRVLGDWWKDRERLRATSPALHAQRIEVPVLLVHGTEDRRVPVQQSRDMAKALASAGRSYRYVEQEGGDHHFSRQAHHTEFLRELESFLQAHLAP